MEFETGMMMRFTKMLMTGRLTLEKETNNLTSSGQMLLSLTDFTTDCVVVSFRPQIHGSGQMFGREKSRRAAFWASHSKISTLCPCTRTHTHTLTH